MPRVLSEAESKRILREAGVPTIEEVLVATAEEAVQAAERIGYPVVLKLCAEGLAHKTERNLVRLDLMDEEEVLEAAHELLEARGPGEREARLLVQRMAQGRREVIAGLFRDAQFGPCVMFGLGGIFAELLGDVAFGVAPLEEREALELVESIAHVRVLGPFRGEPPADRRALARVLVALGRLGVERPEIRSIDVNPLVLEEGRPVAVDALVELES